MVPLIIKIIFAFNVKFLIMQIYGIPLCSKNNKNKILKFLSIFMIKHIYQFIKSKKQLKQNCYMK